MKVQRDGRGFTVDVSADGDGLVSHAGAALLAEVADRVGLTRELSRALAGVRERRGRHDPGRVIRDLAVMLADGGDCLSDLRAVRDQQPLFGPVASDSTAFRLVDRIANDPGLLDAMRVARARARERAWGLGVRPQRIVIDIDATLIGAHTEKEGAAVNFKGTFGFHPLLAYLDEDGVRATELARLSGRHKQIVGRLVDELEELGYVEPQTVTYLSRWASAKQDRLPGLAADQHDLARARGADRLRRHYDELPQRDFEGNTFRIQYDWKPTGKLALAAVAQKDISANEDIRSSFVLLKGFTLSTVLKASEMIEVSGTLEYGTRDYLGDPGLVFGVAPTRKDRVRSATLNVSYRPARNVTLQAGIQREARTSNVPFADYGVRAAFVSVRIAL